MKTIPKDSHTREFSVQMYSAVLLIIPLIYYYSEISNLGCSRQFVNGFFKLISLFVIPSSALNRVLHLAHYPALRQVPSILYFHEN